MAISCFKILLNVLVASCLADVIRDDGYHNYEGQFTVVRKGRMLRVLMYFNNVEQKECALHCVRHLRCKTINYHPIKKACELTDEDFVRMNADTISSGWYNHGTPPKVDGGWSNWRNFTECTKTCENGTLEQWRDCDSPAPEHGGDDCKGRMRRRVKCNTQECPAVNVALGKTATQSSVLNGDPEYASSQAVDGNKKTRAYTVYENNPWWEVDMGEIKVIKNISLTSFLYKHYNNQELLVETLQSQKESWIICKAIGSLTLPENKFKCNEKVTMARFLRIRSTKRCHLTFYEVEIFGK